MNAFSNLMPAHLPTTPAANSASEISPEETNLSKAADQFEGLLMHELIKSMRATVNPWGEEGDTDFGTGMSTEMSDQTLAEHLGGKLGIADVMRKQLTREMHGGKSSSAKDASTIATPSTMRRYSGIVQVSAHTRDGAAPEKSLASSGIVGFEQQFRGALPVQGEISSEYGHRIHPLTHERSFHEGLDIAAPSGTEIHAVDRGKVVFAGNRGGYGKTVEIEHSDGSHTLYGHASALHVRVGDVVEAGETIADVGSTGRSIGPHVHFEAIKDGHAVSPKKYLERLRAYQK